MAANKNTVMAGCLDVRTSLYFILIANLILGGFYFAFGTMEAMRFTALGTSLCISADLIHNCGFAFGEAAFAARAAGRSDYKTVVYVRLASAVLSFSLTAVFALILIAAGRPLASLILGPAAPAEDITTAYGVMICSAVYAAVSCGLCWLRGFYQGAGEIRIDQRSQLITCGAFYIFAFILMVILVFGFHLNRAYSVYGFMGAMILAKLLGLSYYILFDRLRFKKFRAMAKAQMIPAMLRKKVFSSMISFTMPSMIMALCAGLHLLCFNAALYRIGELHSVKYVNLGAFHGLSGWMIPLFAVIPVLFGTAQFEHYAPFVSRKDLTDEKQCAAVEKMLVRFMAYGLAYSFVLGCMAPEITRLVYGADFAFDPVLIMRIEAAAGLLAGLSVMSARVMIILGLGASAMSYALIACAVHIGLLIAMPMRFGMEGMLYAGIASLAVFLFLCFSKISNRRNVSFVKVFIMTLRILLSCMAMNGVYALARLGAAAFMGKDFLIDALIVCAMILAGLMVYTFVLSVSGISLRDAKKRKKNQK